MNEIKFACPHCGQHVACNEGYCGYQIRCPACEGGLIVPRLAAFGFGAATKLSLAVPIATAIPRQVAARGLAGDPPVWTEQEWNRHDEDLRKTGESGARAHPAGLLLLVAPALTGLLVYGPGLIRAGPALLPHLQVAWMVFNLVCSILCAMILSRDLSGNMLWRAVVTLILGVALTALNVTLALFLGCTAAMMKAASGG
jgi:hypothetical protein